MQFFKDFIASALTASFVAVLVGFTSSVAIVFQAAQAFGATPAMIASWLWVLSIGMGVCTVVPFPKSLLQRLLALLGTIASAVHTALQDETHREAALITFLVTRSGVVIAGVGSAFWGVVAGGLALLVQHLARKPSSH